MVKAVGKKPESYIREYQLKFTMVLQYDTLYARKNI